MYPTPCLNQQEGDVERKMYQLCSLAAAPTEQKQPLLPPPVQQTFLSPLSNFTNILFCSSTKEILVFQVEDNVYP